MSRDYKPTITTNGKTTRQIVRCYLTLPAYVGELPLAPGQSWWQTLPPTRTRESNRNKRSRQSSAAEMSDEEVYKPDTVRSQPEGNKMEIDLSTDPWSNKRVFKLFLPTENEHQKDAIVRRIDILMEARTEPDGNKEIIDGGDEYSNCTK